MGLLDRFRRRAMNAVHVCPPHYGGCYRCGERWCHQQSHSTAYEFDKEGEVRSGMFPLCEPCWALLGNATARLPYYRALHAQWIADARCIPDYEPAPWEQIERAVWWEAVQTGGNTAAEYAALA